MIILDAYAVLAFLRGEHAAPQVRELIGGDEEAALTLLGVAEVVDRLVRRAGVPEQEAALGGCACQKADKRSRSNPDGGAPVARRPRHHSTAHVESAPNRFRFLATRS